MRVLFDEPLSVHYGFLWFNSQPAWELPDLMVTRGGQQNGLLGAAVSGVLSMVTGTHTGAVRVRVELHDSAPEPAGAEFDDVVESSREPRGPETTLSSFDYNWDLQVTPVTAYRARWSAANMDHAHEHEYDEDKPDVASDHYVLQLWPAPPAEDAVIRAGSEQAAYWHREAHTCPAPPSPLELAVAERIEAEAEQQRQAAQQRQDELDAWGGQLPTERLMNVGGRAQQLARRDRGLVDAIIAVSPQQQRRLAVEMVRRTAEAAEAVTANGLDWQPALTALYEGRPLPSPFDKQQTLREALFPSTSSETAAAVTVGVARLIPRFEQRPVQDPRFCAMTAVAVVAAADSDPLRAALDAVDAASWATTDDDAFLRQTRTLLDHL